MPTTPNVAVCPAMIFTLAGCDVIAGATGAVVGDIPIPLNATEVIQPFDRLNSNVAE